MDATHDDLLPPAVASISHEVRGSGSVRILLPRAGTTAEAPLRRSFQLHLPGWPGGATCPPHYRNTLGDDVLCATPQGAALPLINNQRNGFPAGRFGRGCVPHDQP